MPELSIVSGMVLLKNMNYVIYLQGCVRLTK
jgi:hypothetical protein